MQRWQMVSVLWGALTLWASACGGKAIEGGTSGTTADASAGTESGTDGGLPPGCPTSVPNTGDSCEKKGLVCAYASDSKPCGTFTCADDGEWQGGGVGSLGCPLPPGLVCPKPMAPQLTGTTSPIDLSCDGDSDCSSVVFETDCCGNTLAFGVNMASTDLATSAAATCARSFPGCGCPARPTVPETLPEDGGAGTSGIEAYCASGTCKTRYR